MASSSSRPPDPPPEAQLAAVRADIERRRRWAGPLLAPVWDVLARLAAIMAALIRRQG
jgi:hypothetical protein